LPSPPLGVRWEPGNGDARLSRRKEFSDIMPSNVATSSTTKAMEWYCSKPGQGGMKDSICKRTAIQKKV
jgi:hypothetical protein